MSFRPTYVIRSPSPYISPYSNSFSSVNNSSTSKSLSLPYEPERSNEHPCQCLRSELSDEASEMAAMVHQNHQYDSTLYEASPPSRSVVPDIVVTTATPMAPLIPPYLSLDPSLFLTLEPRNYPEFVLSQLCTLFIDIESTMDTQLMRQLPKLHSLLYFLSSFSHFRLISHNIPAFQSQVGTHFFIADIWDEPYFAVKPEPELKMVFAILDERYTDTFPHRAACLIYPDDFECQTAEEMDIEESACRFAGRDKGGVDQDTGVSAPGLVHRRGWGGRAKYVVTASYAGDVGVEYPRYHF